MDNYRTRKKRVVNDGKGVKLGGRVGGKVGDPASGTGAKVASRPATRAEQLKAMRRAMDNHRNAQAQAEQARQRKADQARYALNNASNRQAVREGRQMDLETTREIASNYKADPRAQGQDMMRQRTRKWMDTKSRGK